MTKQYKLADSEFKVSPTGDVQFYASVFGTPDLVKDIVMPGAFTKSLDDWRAKDAPIPIVFGHNWQDPFAYVGAADPHDVVEDDYGLLVRGRLDIEDNPKAKNVWSMLKRRIVTSASFAYDIVRAKMRGEFQELHEVTIHEVGPCLKGAHPDAGHWDVKDVPGDDHVSRFIRYLELQASLS